MSLSDPRPSSTFGAHSTGFLAAAVEYFSARLRLLGIESKEAALRYAMIGALAASALFALALGYVFVVLAVLFAIAAAFDNPHAWLWITGAAAFLHFVGAAGLLWSAYTRLHLPIFTETLAELQKDSQWLHPLPKTP